MDLLRLQKALLMCRMAANSTFLVDKQEPAYSSKLEHLDELLEQLFAEDGPQGRPVLRVDDDARPDRAAARAARPAITCGSTARCRRRSGSSWCIEFQDDPDCRLFITTNAGSTGLNLQAANTVINVDLPWNPAVLEQRIARAHRMGQSNPVQVYVLVTEETIEESLLRTLSAKHDLALAALDVESDVEEVDLVSGIEELKRRLEVLVGARQRARGRVVTRRAEAEVEQASTLRRERVAAAGGELLGAVFNFLGQLTATDEPVAPPAAEVVSQIRERLNQCVEDDPEGRPRLSVTLPDRSALDGLAETMARLLVGRG